MTGACHKAGSRAEALAELRPLVEAKQAARMYRDSWTVQTSGYVNACYEYEYAKGRLSAALLKHADLLVQVLAEAAP